MRSERARSKCRAWRCNALVIFFILGVPEAQMSPGHHVGARVLADADQPDAVKDVMTVSMATEGADGVRIFRGRLRDSADTAYQKLKRAVGAQTVPMLQEDEHNGAAVVLMPRPVERERLEHPIRPVVHGLLFALTVVTTTWAGAAHQGVNLTVIPGDVAGGMMTGTSVGSSLLFALLAKLSLGSTLEDGHVLRLTPMAFAGWLGLFITALNLLPIGQLDGGHMATAMFGRRVGGTIGTVAMWTLLLLAIFVWPGLTMWAILVFFMAGTRAAPLNDVTRLTQERQWVGYATFAILALILAPLPHSLWSAAGIHCPYV